MKVFSATLYMKNYGSVLQAFALQQKLKQLGAEPKIIKRPSPISKDSVDRMSFGARVKYFFKPEKHYGLAKKIRRMIERRVYKDKQRKLNSFVTSKIDTIDYKESLDVVNNEPCILLAGSDQIWNCLNHEVDSFYYFDYTQNPLAKKASFAASIGVSELSEEKKEYYKKILGSFDVVSFREKVACDLLSSHLSDKTVRCDIDPTLLHDKDFWSKIACDKQSERPYIFVYMLRPDKKLISLAKKAAKKRGCDIIYMGLFVNHYAGVKTIDTAGIEEFLSYIKNAEAVITNSFHGTVFSFVFERPFASVKIESTSSRSENLLGILGLENHLISDSTQLEAALCDCDYENAQKRLLEKREESVNYLKSLLELD